MGNSVNREAQEADGGQWFLINYECEECGCEWQQEWSCACDDECPSCGKDIPATDYACTEHCECEECLDDSE